MAFLDKFDCEFEIGHAKRVRCGGCHYLFPFIPYPFFGWGPLRSPVAGTAIRLVLTDLAAGLNPTPRGMLAYWIRCQPEGPCEECLTRAYIYRISVIYPIVKLTVLVSYWFCSTYTRVENCSFLRMNYSVIIQHFSTVTGALFLDK